MAGARGEGYIQREDGDRLPVLFTNRALAEAEKALGKTIMQLVAAMGVNALGIADTAQLLAIGLEHARRETRSRPQSYTINDAFAILDELGFGTVAAEVFSAVAAVLAYSGSKEKADNPPV